MFTFCFIFFGKCLSSAFYFCIRIDLTPYFKIQLKTSAFYGLFGKNGIYIIILHAYPDK